MVGYAHTLRYVAAARGRPRRRPGAPRTPRSARSRAVEPGDVLVMEARGETGAGTIGDILAARVLARGGAGIVTDGGVRDTPGLAGARNPHLLPGRRTPPSLWNAHIPLEIDVPITCARRAGDAGRRDRRRRRRRDAPARRPRRGDRARRARAGVCARRGRSSASRPASRSAASTRCRDERRDDYEALARHPTPRSRPE